jgi:hypothetical protein
MCVLQPHITILTSSSSSSSGIDCIMHLWRRNHRIINDSRWQIVINDIWVDDTWHKRMMTFTVSYTSFTYFFRIYVSKAVTRNGVIRIAVTKLITFAAVDRKEVTKTRRVYVSEGKRTKTLNELTQKPQQNVCVDRVSSLVVRKRS